MNHYQRISEFAKPFDPSEKQLSTHEKTEAFLSFNSLIDDVLLAYADKVASDKFYNSDESYSRIDLYIKADGKTFKELLQIGVIVTDTSSEIHLEEVGTSDFGTKISYRSSIGGEDVRRVGRLDGVSEIEDTTTSMGNVLGAFAEKLMNDQLLIDLGYDNQPVDSDEVSQLRSILLNAETWDYTSHTFND
jgi:hypothetical protein